MFVDNTTIIAQDSSINSSIQKLQSFIKRNKYLQEPWFLKLKLILKPTKNAAKAFALRRYN